MKCVMGTKVGMTSIFDEQGKVHAATVVYVEPNKIIGVKTKDKDGYQAIRVGYDSVDAKKLNKPDKGQFKNVNHECKRFIREFRDCEGNVGDELKVDIFKKGEYVDVQGISKGHGFTGSIKRHNFSIGPLGHGAGYPHRYVGSISGGRGGSQAQRVFKGTELPGHYGHEVVTMSNLLILDIDTSKNLMVLKGSVPGNNLGLLNIKLSQKKLNQTNELKLFSNANKQKVESKPENVKSDDSTNTQSSDTQVQQNVQADQNHNGESTTPASSSNNNEQSTSEAQSPVDDSNKQEGGK